MFKQVQGQVINEAVRLSDVLGDVPPAFAERFGIFEKSQSGRVRVHMLPKYGPYRWRVRVETGPGFGVSLPDDSQLVSRLGRVERITLEEWRGVLESIRRLRSKASWVSEAWSSLPEGAKWLISTLPEIRYVNRDLDLVNMPTVDTPTFEEILSMTCEEVEEVADRVRREVEEAKATLRGYWDKQPEPRVRITGFTFCHEVDDE